MRWFFVNTRETTGLPQEQRLMLAHILSNAFDSLPFEPLSEVEAAWENEIAQRIQAIDAGQTQGKPWDAVLQDINSGIL